MKIEFSKVGVGRRFNLWGIVWIKVGYYEMYSEDEYQKGKPCHKSLDYKDGNLLVELIDTCEHCSRFKDYVVGKERFITCFELDVCFEDIEEDPKTFTCANFEPKER